jgi:predicted nucleic acid-binding Zn ribbon protein
MALVPCTECGHEISTEARTCPNCGAKNRNRVQGSGKYWLLAGILMILFVVLSIIGKVENVQDEVIHCDSPEMVESYRSAFDESQGAQTLHLRVVDVTNITTVKSGDSITDFVCDATLSLNNANKINYRFKWIESESGNILINGSRRK